KKNKIFNTNLFITVDVQYTVLAHDSIAIKIGMLERWYLFPFPLFELADRNFNEWWRNRGADIRRINYGVVVAKRNFRGLNETIQLRAQGGFTPRIGLAYQIPFLDKQQSLGLTLRTDYAVNKVYDYATIYNKGQDTSKDDRNMFRMIMTYARMTKRIGFYDFHEIELRYRNMQIDSFIAQLNPYYFLDSAVKQQFFSLTYAYIRNKRDFNAYPMKGSYFTFIFSKTGLLPDDDFNGAQVEVGYAKYFNFGGKRKVLDRAGIALGGVVSLATGINVKFSTPMRQPYLLARSLGYSSYIIRGYDRYIAESQHIGVMKNTLRWQVLDTKASLRKILPLSQFNTIPTTIYLKAYFDAGYVYHPDEVFIERFHNQRLFNRPLWGGGVGLDIVTFYNLVLRFEVSYNPLDRKFGFFFYRSIEL
ncbi:MAG: outer membrane protein assembly factor, partial [Candidatus Calescibacterium sp.]|nr:outer membrane protein assembly factor [Candidatus Calescibacterium sp.]